MNNGCIMLDCQNQGELCKTCNTGLNNYKSFGRDLTKEENDNYNKILLTKIFKKTNRSYYE